MGVPCGCLDLAMAQELADHRQALPGGDSGRGEGVPEFVDADVIQAGARPDLLPEGLKVGQPRAEEGADDHPGVRLHPGDFLQNIDRRLAEVDDLGAGLGIRQPQRFARVLDGKCRHRQIVILLGL